MMKIMKKYINQQKIIEKIILREELKKKKLIENICIDNFYITSNDLILSYLKMAEIEKTELY